MHPDNVAATPGYPMARMLGAPVAVSVDRMALRAVVRWYLPLCKALAMTETADSAEAFAAAAPGTRPTRTLERNLTSARAWRAALAGSVAAWEAGFYAPQPPPTRELARLEAERARATARYAACRLRFLPLLDAVPIVDWQIGPPCAPETGSHDLRDLARALAGRPGPEAIQETHRLPTGRGEMSWLRFPSSPDAATARVLTPRGFHRAPTVIYAHPFGSEFDLGTRSWDPFDRLAAHDIRLIRAEGPWHGRRRPAGRFSGEPVLARAPLGLAEYLEAHIRELALLIAWARHTGSGPVAVAGTSLGALAGQLLATVAADWPAGYRPDALLLVGPSLSLLDVMRGSLTSALGLPQALADAGWGDSYLGQWAALAEPDGRSAVPAERTLLVLGTHDDVTPYASGLALAAAWHLPTASVFRRRQGHFMLPASLLADDAPLRRLAALLTAQSPAKPSRLRSAAR